MKIRNNFVSNSSSSSFVVFFKEKPKTVEAVKELLFSDEEWYIHPYPDIYNDISRMPAQQAAETVFNDIKKQEPNNIKEILNTTQGWDEYEKADKIVNRKYGLKEFETPPNDDVWNEKSKLADKFTKEKWDKFKKENGDGYYYIFEYSDNDGGYFCALEHGDLFKNLPCIKTSHH